MTSVVLFGEAERGQYRTGYFCQSLPELLDYLGNPPPNSLGLYYAVQTLLYGRNLLFFRVKEEGFSFDDYYRGLELLHQQNVISNISAICAPGVGDRGIIDAIVPICLHYHSILITNESDLYDYLTV